MKKILSITAMLLMVLTMNAIAEGDQPEIPDVAITQWTDQMELFMEHPVLLSGQAGRFIIHLTVLDGFQPIREGQVTLLFKDSSGTTHKFMTTELLREGIFTPTVELPQAGKYEFKLSYQRDNLSETFEIDNFSVYQTIGDIPTEASTESSSEIGFLKEQQWKIPFATATAEVREIKRSVWAIAEVLPSPQAYAEITAPVDGVVEVASSSSLALPGSIVRKGDVLASITPPVLIDGWTASRLVFEQAESNYNRAKRLRERDAISEREFEQARTEYLTRKAGFDVLEGGGDVRALNLKAPIDGQIIEWQVQPGRRVSAGDMLMAVVNPAVVWLKVNVYENDFRTLGQPVGVYVNTDGAAGGWAIPAQDLRVLTTGGALNPATRTIPVLIEINNSAGHLSVNETSPVQLYASDGNASVAVPRTAVYEDNGLHAVFVQISGESFEKRQVTTGPHHDGWVSIIDGLQRGERIVSLGGYHVKLASTSAEIGHGHAH